ncbi:hypothetical protein INT47_007539 [Mucor saturninus]|uniref:Uncharacterized protein n=1 Tax=Mucor saturninus TaxID=64648 RepID=A0A8H7R6D0_9FUNG|nr:hypothetical protein INT47_007539 [Mucor saturninus]
MNVLKKFKQDTNAQTDMITALESTELSQAEKIISLEQKLCDAEKQLEVMKSEKLELELTISKQVTHPSGGLQVIIDNLQLKLKEAEASVAASQKALQSKNVYINQLEAKNEKLADDINVNKVPKTSDKHRQEIAGKNNLIRTLQNDNKSLKAEIESVQAKFDKLEDDFMTLEVEAGLSNNGEEAKALKLKLDQVENDHVEAKSRIQHLELKLTCANDEKQSLRKMLELAKQRAETSNSFNSDKANLDKSRQELVHTREQLMKSTADYTASREKLDQLQKAIRDLQSENNKILQNRDELQQRVDNLIRSKAQNTAAMSFSEQETADINPALVTKIHSLKASNLMYKDENKYLKERVRKLTISLSKNQNLDDLLKSGSSDDEAGNMVDYMPDKSVKELKAKRHSSISSHHPTDSGMIPSRSVKSTSLLNTASSHQTPKPSEPSVHPARGLNVALGKPTVDTQQGLARSAAKLSPPLPAQVLPARPPNPAALPKGKKKDNRLTKFVNSRNPSKVIDSRPIISPVHDRPPATEERMAKKTKMNMRYVSMVEEWIQKKKLANVTDSDIDNILEEINSNFKVMKSVNNPDPKTMSKYGIFGLYQIDVPDKWDLREKAYAWILSYYCSQNAKAFHDIFARLSAELAKCLKAKRPDVSGSRYCRLLCLLCKSRNDVERARTLCFDVIRQSTCNNNTFACLYNIVCGWQNCLVSGKEPSLLLKAVQSSIQHIYDHSGIPDNVKVMYSEITKRCDWTALNRIPPTSEVIEEVMAQLLALEGVPVTIAFDCLRFQIVKSFELIFHVLGDWKKMYNEFILVKLWPLLTRDVIDDVALETMAVLGTFGLSQDPLKEDQPGVQYLFDIMIQVASVEVSADDERDIQMTAIKGAWMLGAHDPIRVAKIRQCVETINNSTMI